MDTDFDRAERNLTASAEAMMAAGVIDTLAPAADVIRITSHSTGVADVTPRGSATQRFRARPAGGALVEGFLADVRAFVAAAEEDERRPVTLLLRVDGSGGASPRVTGIVGPYGIPWPGERRKTRGPDMSPWRLGVLDGPCPEAAEALPPDVAARCEPRRVLDSLVGDETLDLGIEHPFGRVRWTRRPLGSIEVASGVMVVAPLQVPVRSRPVVLRVSRGEWHASQWSCRRARGAPSAVALVRTSSVATWALLGNPSRRIRRTPWVAFPKHHDGMLIGDQAIVDGLLDLWRGSTRPLRRALERCLDLSDRVRASIQPAPGRETLRAVHTTVYSPGPSVYAGLDRRGDTVAVIATVEDATGSMHR